MRSLGLIRINRDAKAPSVLGTSTARDRYRHPDVVSALFKMQHGKCCYCEVYVPDSGLGKQVEHFRPRSQFEALTNDWNNLLLACATCNHAKSSKFPVADNREPLLLNPSDPTLDPEDHIEFVVRKEQSAPELPLGLARPRDLSSRGSKSIQVLKLWKAHHVKSRRETLEKLMSWYVSLLTEVQRIACRSGDSGKVDCLKSNLRKANGDDKAYAGLVRTFHREYQLHKFGIQ